MTVNGLRAALFAASLSLSLAVGVTAAHACSEPSLRLNEEKAKVGERVSFSISDTTPGAEYLLKVGDEELKSGTASGTSVSGKFKMPDLGSPSRDAQVQAVLAHDDCENSPWKVSEPIAYQVAVPKKGSGQGQQRAQQSPLARQLVRLREQQAKQNVKRQEEARKRAKKQDEARKRKAAKLQAAARKQAKKRKEQQAKQQRAFQKQLEAARRQNEKQQAAQQKKQQAAQTPRTATQRARSGASQGSKPFIALGLLYAFLGGLGGGGFLLYRRSQRGVRAAEVEADGPLMREFGEEFDLEPKTKKPKPAEATADGDTPVLAGNGVPEETPEAEKERLEAELRRILTEAGIDAELEGIIADVQAEAERRGVPVDADLMLQLLFDEDQGQANLSEPAEARLRSKLEEIVAEEKERLALPHPES